MLALSNLPFHLITYRVLFCIVEVEMLGRISDWGDGVMDKILPNNDRGQEYVLFSEIRKLPVEDLAKEGYPKDSDRLF